MSIDRAFRLTGKDGGVRIVVCPRKQIKYHIQDGDDVIEFMKPLKEPINPKQIDYIANFDPISKEVVIKSIDPVVVTEDSIDDTSISNNGE